MVGTMQAERESVMVCELGACREEVGPAVGALGMAGLSEAIGQVGGR